MVLMLLTVMVVKSNMYIFACLGYSGNLGDGIHELEVAAIQSIPSCRGGLTSYIIIVIDGTPLK